MTRIIVMQFPMPGEDIDEDEDGAYCGATWKKVDEAEVEPSKAYQQRKAFKRKYRGAQYSIIG